MDDSPTPGDAVPEVTPGSGKKVNIAFGSATLVLALITLFYFKIMPHHWRGGEVNPLFAVPQFVLLLTLIVPILWWQTLADRAMSRRISVISSAIIWVLGIVAAFVFHPPSPYITVSDGLLLLGFVPLLYLWRFSIPWVIFGVFNGAIGIFLLLLSLLSDSYFPANLWPPKHHLAEFHPWLTWILFGFAACLFGLVRWIKNMFFLAHSAGSKKDA